MKQQKLLSLIRQAIQDYNMIEEGDRIAVGVSGGKDSLTLLYAMKLLQGFYPKRFELSAITCNVGFEGMDFTGVAEYCKHLEIPYEQVDTEIARIVFQENKDVRPCSLCAKLRKGAMYQRLGELRINKMAYAHNKDDFIETALMSLIYEGRFYAFPPVTELPEAGVTVIRPMMYVPEQGVAHFVADQGIRVVKNTCPVDGSTKRAYAKQLIKDDFIETALMSLIYEGRFYAFPPVTELPEAGVTVIRPMMYVPEQGVAHFVADQGIRVVKNTCPVDGSTKRAYAKQLIEQINRETPGAKERIMHAIMNGRFPDWPM